jgi:hypothetical protein
MSENGSNSLNWNHRRRLSVTCRHIDRLLAEVDAALNPAASKRAFPQYHLDLSREEKRMVEDHIAGIRARLVNILRHHEMEPSAADIPVSRLLHTTLTFVDIAVEELRPRHMRGYGAVPPAAAAELNAVVEELQAFVRELNHNLACAPTQNPE